MVKMNTLEQISLKMRMEIELCLKRWTWLNEKLKQHYFRQVKQFTDIFKPEILYSLIDNQHFTNQVLWPTLLEFYLMNKQFECIMPIASLITLILMVTKWMSISLRIILEYQKLIILLPHINSILYQQVVIQYEDWFKTL